MRTVNNPPFRNAEGGAKPMQENRYIDTRGCVDQPVEFTEAVINGLADGGGLYVPQHIPELTLDEICELAQLPYAQRASTRLSASICPDRWSTS